jgi:hypothetical protein
VYRWAVTTPQPESARPRDTITLPPGGGLIGLPVHRPLLASIDLTTLETFASIESTMLETLAAHGARESIRQPFRPPPRQRVWHDHGSTLSDLGRVFCRRTGLSSARSHW